MVDDVAFVNSDLIELSYWKRSGENLISHVYVSEILGIDDWQDIPVESVRPGMIADTMEEVILSVRIPAEMKYKLFLRLIVEE